MKVEDKTMENKAHCEICGDVYENGELRKLPIDAIDKVIDKTTMLICSNCVKMMVEYLIELKNFRGRIRGIFLKERKRYWNEQEGFGHSSFNEKEEKKK